jgi:hypothetical protein
MFIREMGSTTSSSIGALVAANSFQAAWSNFRKVWQLELDKYVYGCLSKVCLHYITDLINVMFLESFTCFFFQLLLIEKAETRIHGVLRTCQS